MRHADLSPKKKELVPTFCLIAILVLCIPWAMFWYTVAVKQLWSWFVVPLFVAATLTLAQAYGLSLATQLIMGFRLDESNKRENLEVVIRGICLPPLKAGLLLVVGKCAYGLV
ncbi:hypothetical protein WAE61_01995 [Comamonadaceae bacterium PP-2]